MFAGYFMATVVMISFGSGLAAGDLVDRAAAGLIPRWRAAMPNVPKVPGAQQPGHPVPKAKEVAPAAPVHGIQTRPVMVRLDELVLMPERFSQRPDEELTEATRLRSLADAIVARGGIQVPIEFFVNEKGQKVVDAGNRRTAASRLLAKENWPGYTFDMEVPAIEVVGASQQELLLRSVTDNSQHLTLTQTDRIRAAKMLLENHIKKEDAATALGVSVTQLKRDLVIAEHPWMFDFVVKNAITPSSASRLLEVAVAENQIGQLQTDFTAWVAETEKKIEVAKMAEKLTVAQQLVRTYVTSALLGHWVAQMKRKESLTKLPAARREILEVEINPQKNKVSIGGTEIDLMAVSLQQLAEMVSDVETAKKVMLSYLKVRKALGGTGPQERDLEVLREEGLVDLADAIERDRMEATQQAHEEVEESEETTDGNAL